MSPEPTAITIMRDEPSLELVIAAWLDSKSKRSNSVRTRDTYARTIADFRVALRAMGLDLDSDARAVALAAQAWAGLPKRNGQPVAPATLNQRLAVISSLYTFGRRRELLRGENPIERIERGSVQPYAAAVPLDPATVVERMRAIDRTTLIGKRDYALLSIGLQTGRRATELANLQWGDMRITGGRVALTFRRAKGGKVMHDELPLALGQALLEWLHGYYGRELGSLHVEAPLWASLDPHTRGHRLTVRAISKLCLRRMGVSKIHTLRHTFAHAMEQVGASVSEIQTRLGHSSLQTTGRYLARLQSAQNRHGDDLAELFGFQEPAPGQPPRRRRR